MNSITPRSAKKKITLIVVAIVLLAGVIGYLLYSNKTLFNQSSIDSSGSSATDEVHSATQEQTDDGKTIKQNEVDPNEPPEVMPDGTVKVEIPQPSMSGDTLRVKSIIHKLTTKGACTLVLSSEGQTSKTYSAGVQPLASYTTCKGFEINVSSFASGTWDIELRYSNGSVSGSAKTKVEI